MMRRRAMLCVAIAVAIAGCSKDESTPMTPTPAEPVADSPENAVRVLQSAFDHKDEQAWEIQFTADYEFPLNLADTTFNNFLIREQEIEFARNLFVRGVPGIPLTPPRSDQGSPEAAQVRLPPADKITCLLTEPLVATTDPRPGKAPEAHRRVQTRMELTVETPSGGYFVEEAMTFYLVRGDSASIDASLRERGVTSDSTRWYIDRWESDTVQAVGSVGNTRALPAERFTLALFKRLYLGEFIGLTAARAATTPRP
jgi:hypothetical protein